MDHMIHLDVTKTETLWSLSAQEVAHAMPVLQAVHPALQAEPAPRLAAIRRLAERCGVRDGALRTALSRACSAGSLLTEGGRYRLGPLSREDAAAAHSLMERIPGYVLALVREGEGRDLAALRDVFERMGLRPLQRSVWIGARTADDRLTAALASAGLGSSATVFQTDEVDADVKARLAALWGLSARAAALRTFHDALVGYLGQPGIGPTEVGWRCVQAAPVWYRIAVREEPPFPLDLCDGDYPLKSLNAAWRDHLETTSPQLIDLWRSCA
jgi:DNA-binding transcriptional regulator PaaX